MKIPSDSELILAAEAAATYFGALVKKGVPKGEATQLTAMYISMLHHNDRPKEPWE